MNTTEKVNYIVSVTDKNQTTVQTHKFVLYTEARDFAYDLLLDGATVQLTDLTD
jgi:hypothetical protein